MHTIKINDIPGCPSLSKFNPPQTFILPHWNYQPSQLTLPSGGIDLQKNIGYLQSTALNQSYRIENITDQSGNESDGIPIRHIKKRKHLWTREQRDNLLARKTRTAFFNKTRSQNASFVNKDLHNKSQSQEFITYGRNMFNGYFQDPSTNSTSNNMQKENEIKSCNGKGTVKTPLCSQERNTPTFSNCDNKTLPCLSLTTVHIMLCIHSSTVKLNICL